MLYSISATLIDVDDDLSFIELVDRLCDFGCDDGTFGMSNGLYIMDFEREAKSLDEAFESVRNDILSSKVCKGVIIKIRE